MKNDASNANSSKLDTVNADQIIFELTSRERVSGTQIAYYFLCHRKLWLFSHHITFEHESEDVKIGKQVNQESYSRSKKDINIDQTISIDFLKEKNGVVIHEVKKSNKMEESHKWQLLYYLYYLKRRGIDATGVINYPLLNKKEELSLDQLSEITLEKSLLDIERVLAGELPRVLRIPICKKCAYFEFCFGDDL